MKTTLTYLETNRTKHNQDCVEICEEILELAKAGNLKNLIVAWENTEGYLHDSYSGTSTIALLGLLDIVKQGMRCRFMGIERGGED
jgi:hypothetical protein